MWPNSWSWWNEKWDRPGWQSTEQSSFSSGLSFVLLKEMTLFWDTDPITCHCRRGEEGVRTQNNALLKDLQIVILANLLTMEGLIFGSYSFRPYTVSSVPFIKWTSSTSLPNTLTLCGGMLLIYAWGRGRARKRMRIPARWVRVRVRSFYYSRC